MDTYIAGIHEMTKKRHRIHPAPPKKVEVEGNKSQELGMPYFISLFNKNILMDLGMYYHYLL